MSSATIHADARAALRTRLKLVPGLPAARAWEGVDYTPTTGVPFIEDKLTANDSIPRSIGAIEHQISYILTLKYPGNQGTGDIEAMGGLLLDQFKVGTSLAYGASSLLCTKAARRGSIVQDGGWSILTVVVAVTAFTIE